MCAKFRRAVHFAKSLIGAFLPPTLIRSCILALTNCQTFTEVTSVSHAPTHYTSA